MSIKCPLMSRNLVIADDARLAAQLSCALSETGRYLPVIEGPRMSRADSDAKIARRNNAASRVKPEAIFLAGLPDDTAAAVTARFTPRLRRGFGASLRQKVLTGSIAAGPPRPHSPGAMIALASDC